MTTAEKLAEVTAQIRKDIPRLMELREGCWFINFNGNKHKSLGWYINKENNRIHYSIKDEYMTYQTEEQMSKIEIIGHDIMLNDVLEWLNHIIYEKCIPINDLGYSGMVKQFYVKGDDGSIIFEILDLKNPDLGLDTIRYGVWDLSSIYLKDQSEELIKFLYNIKINKVMETLKDIFVPYEIAVQLKEIGFDEPCIGYYEKDNPNVRLNEKTHGTIKHNSLLVYISAPTYEQVFKWFEYNNLYGNVVHLFSEGNDKIVAEYAFNWFKCLGKYDDGTEFGFESHKQAQNSLILKLIKIYKK